jgi:hypothetical protein
MAAGASSETTRVASESPGATVLPMTDAISPMNEGVDDVRFIAKPLHLRDLAATINETLGS